MEGGWVRPNRKGRQHSLNQFWKSIALVLVLITLPATLHAADETTTEVTSSPNTLVDKPSSLLSRLSFSYFGIYTGPSLNQPVNAGGVNSNTGVFDPTSLQNLQAQFRLDYSITPDIFAGPIIYVTLVPFNSRFFNMYDSGVRIGHKQIIHTDTFNFSEDVRALVALEDSHRFYDEKLQLATLQLINWQVSKEITLGFIGYHQVFIYGNNTPAFSMTDPNAPLDIQMYVAPTFTYQFTKTLAATLYVEFYPVHIVGAKWNDWTTYPMDIAPGISWDVTPDINISPQVLFYPSHLTASSIGSIIYTYVKFF
jgi:hypothetical protein